MVTIYHGDSTGIAVNSEGIINLYLSDIKYNLDPKIIRTLKLSSCNNGNISAFENYRDNDGDGNVATAFMERNTIQQVYAWDGVASFGFSAGVPLKIFTVQINNHTFGFVLDVNMLMEFSGTNLDILSEELWYYIVHHRLDYDLFDDWALGLVRYYYDDEGNIVYENVSDSGLYFNFWFCV